MLTNKEYEYLDVPRYLANKFSKDKSTKVGAIIIDPETYQILLTGYNGFPRKVKELAERLERPTKYLYTEHAERNAIYHAARKGPHTDGATMICTMFPCADCARAIIQSGIIRVISPDIEIERWAESSQAAKEMLIEAGVEIEYYTLGLAPTD